MIREIKNQDFDGLMKLYMQLHDNPLPEDTTALMKIGQEILDDKNHHIIVAWDNRKIVSSCVCIVVPNLTHNQQPYALVENVITDEAYRNKRLATKCLNYAKEYYSGGIYEIKNKNLTDACCISNLDKYLSGLCCIG